MKLTLIICNGKETYKNNCHTNYFSLCIAFLLQFLLFFKKYPEVNSSLLLLILYQQKQLWKGKFKQCSDAYYYIFQQYQQNEQSHFVLPEHKENHDIWRWTSRAWLGTSAPMWWGQIGKGGPNIPILKTETPTAIQIYTNDKQNSWNRFHSKRQNTITKMIFNINLSWTSKESNGLYGRPE